MPPWRDRLPRRLPLADYKREPRREADSRQRICRNRSRPPASRRAGRANMKVHDERARFTVGTRDGATIEMARKKRARRTCSCFGLSAEQVSERPWQLQPVVAPRERTGDPRGARFDLLSGHFSQGPSPTSSPHFRDRLLDRRGLLHAPRGSALLQRGASPRPRPCFTRPDEWAGKAPPQRGGARGRFSSDRTIAQYAAEIWGTTPCSGAVSVRSSPPGRAASREGFPGRPGPTTNATTIQKTAGLFSEGNARRRFMAEEAGMIVHRQA